MVIDHPDLPHFPDNDPPATTEKESLRQRIARETADFLAKGNEIKQIDHTANKTWGEPIKRSKKEQQQTMKRRLNRPPSHL